MIIIQSQINITNLREQKLNKIINNQHKNQIKLIKIETYCRVIKLIKIILGQFLIRNKNKKTIIQLQKILSIKQKMKVMEELLVAIMNISSIYRK